MTEKRSCSSYSVVHKGRDGSIFLIPREPLAEDCGADAFGANEEHDVARPSRHDTTRSVKTGGAAATARTVFHFRDACALCPCRLQAGSAPPRGI